MQKKRKRRPFTLLEVMIALALASMLMFFLFDMYREIGLQKIEAEKLEAKQFAQQKVQMRLTEIFSKVVLREEESFSAGHEEIFFTFQNGVDADSRFSGELQATLSYSKKGLELRIRPLEGHAERVELLMENEGKGSFEYFDKEKNWAPTWGKESHKVPAMIKFKITEKEETKDEKKVTEFAFFLPPANLPAEYS